MAQQKLNPPRRLVYLTSALLLAFSVGAAKADVFGSGDHKSVTDLVARIAAVEAQLADLPATGGDSANTRASVEGSNPAPPPGIKRAQDLDILADPPYVVLGVLDGQHLVRKGSKRFLLSNAEFVMFEADELRKAHTRIAQVSGGISGDTAGGALSKLPPPPPPAGAQAATNHKPAGAAPTPTPRPARYATSPGAIPASGASPAKK